MKPEYPRSQPMTIRAATSYEVLAIDAIWPRVSKVLRRQKVLRALDAGMVSWCDEQGYVWDRRKGPAYYSMDPVGFKPGRNTPDWYRCDGACHWIAVWNCAVGQAVFPELDWFVAKGRNHSTAYGHGDDRSLIFDILWGLNRKTNKGIIRGTGKKPRCYTLDEEIKWLETRPYRRAA